MTDPQAIADTMRARSVSLDDVDVGASASGAPPTASGPQHGELPDDIPIEVLGRHGDTLYILDADRQLRVVRDHELSPGRIDGLLGRHATFALMAEWWGRKSEREGKVTGIDYARARREIIQAAGGRIFDPSGRIRGVGAWTGLDGELILHLGDVLWCATHGRHAQNQPVGLFGECVYPRAPAVVRPSDEPAGEACGGAVMRLLERWCYQRPEIDRRMLLGWIALAPYGGAIDWRTTVWVSGPAGAGKTTLLAMIEQLLGGGIIRTTDATEAGVRQALGHQSVPVLIDEAEPSADLQGKVQAILRLARQSSSGARVLRGGVHHQGSDFLIQSMLMLASILVPPLDAQDLDRIASVVLMPFDAAAPPLPMPTDRDLRRLGALLRRRVLDRWWDLDARRNQVQSALVAQGMSRRVADLYAGLLAAADLVLSDQPLDAATLSVWADDVIADHADRRTMDLPSWQACLETLTGWMVVEHHESGKTFPIYEYIRRAANLASKTQNMADAGVREANAVLEAMGTKVVLLDRLPYLAIRPQGVKLEQIYRNTPWYARGGTVGGWVQELLRAPGAETRQLTVGTRSRGVVCLPINLVIADDGEDAP